MRRPRSSPATAGAARSPDRRRAHVPDGTVGARAKALAPAGFRRPAQRLAAVAVGDRGDRGHSAARAEDPSDVFEDRGEGATKPRSSAPSGIAGDGRGRREAVGLTDVDRDELPADENAHVTEFTERRGPPR